MGKTTTIGKLSNRLANEFNLTVLLGACDTFRAAAVEQLGEWAKRASVSIEVPLDIEKGGDPIPVCSRSVKRGKEEGYDVVIIDTSGRLSNNFELTQQLQEMKVRNEDLCAYCEYSHCHDDDHGVEETNLLLVSCRF